jgi:hypothetical protein
MTDDDYSVEGCAQWLDNKYARHHELEDQYAAKHLREQAALLRERDAQLAAAEQALKCVETVMMLVEPRSNKADYLAALAEARAVLAAIKEQP